MGTILRGVNLDKPLLPRSLGGYLVGLVTWLVFYRGLFSKGFTRWGAMATELVKADDAKCTAGYAHERLNRLMPTIEKLADRLDNLDIRIKDMHSRLDQAGREFRKMQGQLDARPADKG